ncbi:MAG: hypothetical protein V4671_14910 [Armatimonadota bacterium]
MSGFTRSVCPTCQAAYAPRARACGSCGRKRDQKTGAEVTLGRAAVHAQTLEGYRKNRGVIRAVRILSAPGCCPVCTIDDREFPLDTVPPLPHAGCTGPRGCRCSYSPVTVTYHRLGDIPDTADTSNSPDSSDSAISVPAISEHNIPASRPDQTKAILPTRVPHSPGSPNLPEPPLLNWLRRTISDK